MQSVSNLKGNVMSHNLTQPEEVDHIWLAMAVHDMEANTPTPAGVPSNESIRATRRDEFAAASGFSFSYGAAHKKSALSGP